MGFQSAHFAVFFPPPGKEENPELSERMYSGIKGLSATLVLIVKAETEEGFILFLVLPSFQMNAQSRNLREGL